MKIFLLLYMICICFSCTFAAISTIVDNKGASPVVNCYFLYYNYKKMFSGMRHAAGLFRRLFLFLDSKIFSRLSILFVVLQNFRRLYNLLYNLYFLKSGNSVDNELLNLQLYNKYTCRKVYFCIQCFVLLYFSHQNTFMYIICKPYIHKV